MMARGVEKADQNARISGLKSGLGDVLWEGVRPLKKQRARELNEMADALKKVAAACEADGRPDCPIIEGLEGHAPMNPPHYKPGDGRQSSRIGPRRQTSAAGGKRAASLAS